MKIKTIVIGGAAVLLLSVAWKQWDREWAQSLIAPSRTSGQSSIRFDNDEPSADAPRAVSAQPAGRTGVAGVRKCRRGEQVIYTDGDCPAGSREHAVNGGAVTVIPGQRTPPTAKLPGESELPGGRLPHAREILLPDEGQSRMRDQAMERVINR